MLFGPGALKKSSGAGGAPELVELVYAIFPAASNLELGGTTFFLNGALGAVFLGWYIHPLVNKHNYGKSPFLMGESAINGHFQ